MRSCDHSLFGTIDLDGDLESWVTTTTWEGHEVEIELVIDDGAIDRLALDRGTRMLGDLASLSHAARHAITVDASENEEGARLYYEHHQEEFASGRDLETFLGDCYLSSALLSLDEEEEFLVLDFTIGEDHTQYVIAVKFNKQQQVVAVVMEA